jgi:hypothetical protein
MVLAGDTLPIEVYCHLPVLCEDQNLPYVYIPSKTVRSACPPCPIPILALGRLFEELSQVLEFLGLGGLFFFLRWHLS